MNLRNVTIWTTGVMLVLTLLIPVGVIAYAEVFNHNIDFYHNTDIVWLTWLLSGTPLLVSFILAIKLKHKVSSVILLVSTIVYAIWFTFLSIAISMDTCGCAALVFFLIGPLSLPVMLPVWITALILNWQRARKQEPQA